MILYYDHRNGRIAVFHGGEYLARQCSTIFPRDIYFHVVES